MSLSSLLQTSSSPVNSLQFLNKKRLKKQSQLLFEKQITAKLASHYLDKEAELGSDNEEHDDVIKPTYDDDNSIDNDTNEQLKLEKELINDNDQDNYEQNEKFVSDAFIQDKEEIKKVIEGPIQRKTFKEENKKELLYLNESDLPLKLRIEKMNNEHLCDDNLTFEGIVKSYKKMKKMERSDEVIENEELKEVIQNFQVNTIKKINEQNKTQQKEIKERLNENKQILKNVIIVNKKDNNSNLNNNNNSNSNKSNLVVKGNGFSSYSNNKSTNLKFGQILNTKNSFLCQMKKNTSNNTKHSFTHNNNNNNNVITNLSTLKTDKQNNNNNKELLITTPYTGNNNNNNTSDKKQLPGFANGFNMKNELHNSLGNLTCLFSKKK